jgi:hypothetical protein
MTALPTLLQEFVPEQETKRSLWDGIGPSVLLLSVEPDSPVVRQATSLIREYRSEKGSRLMVQELVARAEDVTAPGHLDARVPLETRAWMRAGDLLEKLLAHLAQGQIPDTILCLDPWAAVILSPALNPSPGSKWLYLSDLKGRATGSNAEYWLAVADWVRNLPFDQIVPAEDLAMASAPPGSRDVERNVETRTTGTLAPIPPELGAQRPSSWRWRGIAPRHQPEPPPSIHELDLVLFCRTSPLHLRAALDALARQDEDVTRISVCIVARKPGPDLEIARRVFAQAHPRMTLDLRDLPEFREGLGTLAHEWTRAGDAATFAMLDDKVLVPGNFAKRLGTMVTPETPAPILKRAVLEPEAASRVLAGSLSPVRHYDELLEAAQDDPTGSTHPLSVVWKKGREALEIVTRQLEVWAGLEERRPGELSKPYLRILSLPEKP